MYGYAVYVEVHKIEKIKFIFLFVSEIKYNRDHYNVHNNTIIPVKISFLPQQMVHGCLNLLI